MIVKNMVIAKNPRSPCWFITSEGFLR